MVPARPVRPGALVLASGRDAIRATPAAVPPRAGCTSPPRGRPVYRASGTSGGVSGGGVADGAGQTTIPGVLLGVAPSVTS